MNERGDFHRIVVEVVEFIEVVAGEDVFIGLAIDVGNDRSHGNVVAALVAVVDDIGGIVPGGVFVFDS